jgi:type VI secretion system protein ImpA
MFKLAVEKTEPSTYEDLYSDFLEAHAEFKTLDQVIDRKFGKAAPSLSDCRTILDEIARELSDILEDKRKKNPVNKADTEQHLREDSDRAEHPEPLTLRLPLAPLASSAPQAGRDGSWQQAEELILNGQLDQGLAEMTRLAASETTGRGRFQRKLFLAEVCLASRREHLARAILQELAEQIDKFQLEAWESSELIGSVWTKLYKLYKQSDADADRALKLYDRLCRLDPWQALACGE